MWLVWYPVRWRWWRYWCRETTIARVLPTVTQRTFEMNYFIANWAVPSLPLCVVSTVWQRQPNIADKTERQNSDWDINTHPMSAMHVEMFYLKLNSQHSLMVPIYKLLNSNQTRRWIAGSTDASWTQWGWSESTHSWQSVSSECVLYLSLIIILVIDYYSL